jgi:uncharacterized membrane protein YgcG
MPGLYAVATKLRQPEPPEGRHKCELGQGAGGGDGMDFATGNEVFTFTTIKLPQAQQPSGIMGAWIDATAMPAGAGKQITVQIGTQSFVVLAGTQTYVVCAQTVPANITVTSQGGATGQAQVTLYNYNPLFTGQGGSANSTSGARSGGSSSGGSGSGGGSGGGGGTGGGGKGSLY